MALKPSLRRIKQAYYDLTAGEWVRPIKRGYKLACCDCGLVHRVDFEHEPWGRGRRIKIRFYRDDRATAAVRRARNIRVIGQQS